MEYTKKLIETSVNDATSLFLIFFYESTSNYLKSMFSLTEVRDSLLIPLLGSLYVIDIREST